LSLIYLSIACAAVAGIALIVFSRLSRRRAVRLAIDGVPAAAAPPSPILTRPRLADEGAETRPRPVGEREPVYAGDEGYPERVPSRGEPSFAEEYLPEEEPTPRPSAPQPARPAPSFEREPVSQTATASAAGGHWEEQGEWHEDWGDEVVFPIEDYDELRVAEILPLLPQLEPDELEDVRDREVNTKSRATIVAKIDELLGELEAPAAVPGRTRAPASGTRKAAASPANRPAAARAASGTPAKRAGATGRAGTAAKKAVGTAGRSGAAAKKAVGKAAAVGKTSAAKGTGSRAATPQKATAGAKASVAGKSAGKKAAASKAAPSKTTAGRSAARSTTAQGAAAKKVAKTTKAAPTKAAQSAKKAVKKAGGTSGRHPRRS
jgi:hypothetical protein